MPLSINTGDALASSLTYLFGVDTDNVIREFKAGLALTPHANVRTPATSPASTLVPFGRSFRTGGSVNVGSGAVTTEGVDFTAVPVPNTGPVSVFVVTNQFNSASGAGTNVSGQLFGVDITSKKAGAGIVYDAVTGKFSPSNFQSGVATGSSLHTAGVINTGARSFGFTRNNLSPVFAYIDGALDASFSGGAANNSGQFGFNYSDSEFGYIGGMPTFSYISMDYVYIAVFVGVQLTAADFARLHASLTGGGNFALVTQPPVSPTVGTQPSNISVVEGATATFAAAFGGYPAPTLQWQRSTNSGGTWAAISGATGTSISTAATTLTGGAANNGDQYRCVATNASGTATTNAATLTVTAAGDTTPPVLTGTIVLSNVAQTTATATWPAGTDNSGGAVTYDISLNGGTTYPINWPVATYNLTGLTANTTYALRIRARDPSGNVSTPALAASLTTLATAVPRVLLTATPGDQFRAYGSGALLANKAGTMWISNPTTGAFVVQKTFTTDSAGLAGTIQDAAMALSTPYRLAFEFATGEYGVIKRTSEAT